MQAIQYCRFLYVEVLFMDLAEVENNWDVQQLITPEQSSINYLQILNVECIMVLQEFKMVIYMNGINHQIDETYQQVRSLSHNLIPKKFKKNNFCDVIEEYLSKISNASDIALSIAVYPRKEIDYLSEKLHVEIFKIIQEYLLIVIMKCIYNFISKSYKSIDVIYGCSNCWR